MESTVVKKTIEAGEKLAGIGTEIKAEASQIKGIVVDAFEESLETAKDAAKTAIKRGRNATEDMLDDAAHQVKKHPLQSVGITFGIGLAFGLVIGWLTHPKRR